MIIRRGYKFRLKPTPEVAAYLRLFAGHRRFVYNYFLRCNLHRLENGWPILWYHQTEKWLSDYLLKSEEYGWLKDAPKVVLQQALRDLDRAFKDAFDKEQPNKRMPIFKRKQTSQSFRYPQIYSGKDKAPNLKVDNRRVFLPKVQGKWVGFHKSRDIQGEIKNVTVSYTAGHWYVSLQTEVEIDSPQHPSGTYTGCDRGVIVPFAFSDGRKTKPIKAVARHADRLARLQQQAARQERFSNNWRKTQQKIAKLHHTVACIRKDYLHKLSRTVSNNHALVYLEALQISNMTRSASGTLAEPGKLVAQKRGLNKAILDIGWGMFVEFLDYKQAWQGGYTAFVPAPGTSQTCPACQHRSADNRHTQARFHCAACGFQGNADWVASVNIETRGQAGEFARKSHDAGPELLKFGRGLACGALTRMQETVGSREAVPPQRAP